MMQESTHVPFTFTNLTNAKLAGKGTPQPAESNAASAAQKAVIAEKLRALAAYKALAQNSAADGPSFEELARKALFRGSPSALWLLRGHPIARQVAPKPAALRKLNCGYFRGKKAVFKNPGIRISFELVEKLN